MRNAKIMEVKELFNKISCIDGATHKSICAMKSKCISYENCNEKSATPLIDFDEIAKIHGKKNREKTPASVDGIGMNGQENKLLLVEKKSWSRFFYPHGDDIQNDSTESVDSKCAEYNLETKYRKTCQICQQELANPNLFTNLSHAFVFVTDLQLLKPKFNEEPSATLIEALLMVSHSSNKIVRQDLYKHTLDSSKELVDSVSCINTYYVDCNDYDRYIHEEL